MRSLLAASLAELFTYTPILIFAIMGAWRTFARGWPYILCWHPAVYLTMLHTIFVSSIRYREPAMLALIVLAAGEIATRWGGSEPSTHQTSSSSRVDGSTGG